MLEAVYDGLLNLLDIFKWLIYRIFNYTGLSGSRYSLTTFKWIFGFLIAFSVVFLAIKLIKKATWGK